MYRIIYKETLNKTTRFKCYKIRIMYFIVPYPYLFLFEYFQGRKSARYGRQMSQDLKEFFRSVRLGDVSAIR